MPLLVTPTQLNLRAELYHQLGIMTAAGLTLRSSLEHLQRNPPSRSLRPVIERWQKELNEGNTFFEAMSATGKWISSFDLALLEAGERSGRLDVCFQLLATYYRERAQMVRQIISDSLWPLLTLNVAIVIFPLIDLVLHGNVVGFLFSVGIIAVPVYGGIFAIVFACQGRHGELWRSQIERVLGFVPILRIARQDLALARLSTALESLLNAGVPIIRAWELAATASGSPALKRTVLEWKEPIEQGGNYSELISASPRFPELFANLYHTGEISGTLDHTLIRLHTLYQTEGMRRMKALSSWLPKLGYFAILIYGAYRVVSFYAGYYQQVKDAMS